MYQFSAMKSNQTHFLYKINSPSDLKKLTLDELVVYCEELRGYIIEEVSKNPGHFGSSLGALELAVAIHYVYDTPRDGVVWDVGHQAYAHKIITGRRDLFPTNRKLGGISGFPKMAESEYDSFGAGHSSTSISAALGLAVAAGLDNSGRKSIAVIGDGAMTGGLAFEGLNNAGAQGRDILVILNDNNCSIDPNVGALKEYFLDLTTSRKYNRFKNKIWNGLSFAPRFRRVLQKIEHGAKSFFLHSSNFFESMGFRYFGPADGNDIRGLVRILTDLKQIGGPKLLHLYTVKGKGFQIAEQNKTEWHAPGKFNPETGEKYPASGTLRYQDIFGYTLLDLARGNEKLVGITPAMPSGSSLNIMMEAMPDRAFDVGIAEGHAVTFAAGLAAGGKLPFCNIYSSFSQRAVDNIIHDVALQRLEVVMCFDRAGIVGEDGATHHGVFDIALLRSVPNIIIAAPSSAVELRNIMYTASLGGYGACFVIRYPRGGEFSEAVLDSEYQRVEIGRFVKCLDGEGRAVLTLGDMWSVGDEVARKSGAAHYDMRFAKPLDEVALCEIASRYDEVVVIENGVRAGGVGSAVLEFLSECGYGGRVRLFGIGDEFVEHGTVRELHDRVGLNADTILKTLSLETDR